jgi:hypothetical protein
VQSNEKRDEVFTKNAKSKIKETELRKIAPEKRYVLLKKSAAVREIH